MGSYLGPIIHLAQRCARAQTHHRLAMPGTRSSVANEGTGVPCGHLSWFPHSKLCGMCAWGRMVHRALLVQDGWGVMRMPLREHGIRKSIKLSTAADDTP